MTAGSPRRDLTMLMLLGAAGAGLVVLSARQTWAHIVTAAPKPLPASVIAVSGQALLPAAAALAVAALACLAAVLATRRLLRRIAGIVLAGLGVGIAVAVSAGISAADVVAAASTGSQAGGPGAGLTPGSAAGSTTAGTSGAAGTPLSGFPGHVVFVSFPWRWARPRRGAGDRRRRGARGLAREPAAGDVQPVRLAGTAGWPAARGPGGNPPPPGGRFRVDLGVAEPG